MQKKQVKVFIDTNIWFSAFYGSKNCEKIIKAHLEGKIKAVICRQVLEESIINIKEKVPLALPQFKNFILYNPPEIVANPKTVPHNIKGLVASEDELIFGSAVNTSVQYFITGNIKDFAVKKLQKITKIQILTPKLAVEKLEID